MSPEKQRICIAEACGWKYPCASCLPSKRWRTPADDGCKSEGELPDYLNSLDAMHEAEKVLSDEQYTKYEEILWSVMTTWVDVPTAGGTSVKLPCRIRWLSATAAQRAEAFLRVTGLWKDEP